MNTPIFRKQSNSFLSVSAHSDEWNCGMKDLDKGHIVEMCPDTYSHFMNCLPPLMIHSGAFVAGGAMRFNNVGESVYLCCIERSGRFFGQLGTSKEFRSRELFK